MIDNSFMSTHDNKDDNDDWDDSYYGAIFLGDRGNGPFSEGNYDNCRDSTKHSLIPWLVKAYTKSKFTSPLVSKLVTNQSALALGILLKIYFVFNLL